MSLISQTFPIAEKLIANGLSLTEQLYQALQQESTTLKQSALTETLDEITRQKQPLAQELNLFAKQLAQILETEKLPNTPAGLSDYLERAIQAGFDTSKTAENWTTLIKTTEKCQLLNEQNGASVEILLRHTRQSLNILKGKPQTTNTYGPDGNTKSDLFSGTLFSV
ncbi:flagella synthesis protein FlgN [Methylotuvimicrobium alcaliphilum]|uniref:FlgN family protein n=1 Tax=Methylotuvimicrobium alcaliphilum (strain DSM 19304 / NCIMB 14124 / VKM B-2133 / 20Z) TaxID=1091494 RepID=G4T3Y0_META2|nr:flagellar protein FlgN [Methylotuvimicrobium alcaliphilum]CCE22679.1 FlgN family protein [Methylotuvimicrobium alcaliphilum 20Z]